MTPCRAALQAARDSAAAKCLAVAAASMIIDTVTTAAALSKNNDRSCARRSAARRFDSAQSANHLIIQQSNFRRRSFLIRCSFRPMLRIRGIDSRGYVQRCFIISPLPAETQCLLSRFSCLSHGLALLRRGGHGSPPETS